MDVAARPGAAGPSDGAAQQQAEAEDAGQTAETEATEGGIEVTLPTFYTTKEVADALKISEHALTNMVADGIVNPMRLSAKKRSPFRWTPEDVQVLRRALTPVVVPTATKPPRRRRRRPAEVT